MLRVNLLPEVVTSTPTFQLASLPNAVIDRIGGMLTHDVQLYHEETVEEFFDNFLREYYHQAEDPALLPVMDWGDASSESSDDFGYREELDEHALLQGLPEDMLELHQDDRGPPNIVRVHQRGQAVRRQYAGRGRNYERVEYAVARGCYRRGSIDAIETEEIIELFCGLMTMVCAYCEAQFFHMEVDSKGRYTKCCKDGCVVLPAFPEPTPLIRDLLWEQYRPVALNRKFASKTRTYNTKASFASVVMREHFMRGPGVPCLRVHGTVYHRIGSILPREGLSPCFLQCYFHQDGFSSAASTLTLEEQPLLGMIMHEVRAHNRILHRLSERVRQIGTIPDMQDLPEYGMIFAEEYGRRQHPGRYNQPSGQTGQVAVVMLGEGDEQYDSHRMVSVHLRREEGDPYDTEIVAATNALYDPLSYGITHPWGTEGWSPRCAFYRKKVTGGGRGHRGQRRPEEQWVATTRPVTAKDFYSFRAQVRERWEDDERLPAMMQDTLLYGGTLAMQYWVDMFVKIESDRLDFIRSPEGQRRVRSELYHGIRDAVMADDAEAAGRRVILPSTHIGSPRYCYELYKDSMAIVGVYGPPDLFITFTCNPDWPEIQASLRLPEDSAFKRADIVVRVFHMRLQEMLRDLTKDHVLGKVLAFTYSVEFQKRGLPHAHILLILAAEDKPRTGDDYDRLVCAELPDPVRHPRLRRIVRRHMVHGPCGPAHPRCPCMTADGRCSKRFPKGLQAQTEIAVDATDSHPVYRRRNFYPEGELTDGWVVPYNPGLLMKYNAHINVEIVGSVHTIKYVHKYVFKGPDMVSVALQQLFEEREGGEGGVARGGRVHGHLGVLGNVEYPPVNEVHNYLEMRYVSPPEAFWRIYGYELSGRSHVVCRLPVHLPDCQTVVYQEGEEVEAVQEAEQRLTKLQAYFLANAVERDNPLDLADITILEGQGHRGVRRLPRVLPRAGELLYQDFDKYYAWKKVEEEGFYRWVRRTGQSTKETSNIGRLASVHPSSGDKYYLRLLLTRVRGACSFEDLRTFQGTLYATFKEACDARGFLANDAEWRECLQEAAAVESSLRIRLLFTHILMHNNPTDVEGLWRMDVYPPVHEALMRAHGHESDHTDHDVMHVDERHQQQAVPLYVLMSEDFRYRRLRALEERGVPVNNEQQEVCERDVAECLHFIDSILFRVMGKRWSDYPGLPAPTEIIRDAERENPSLEEQLDYDRAEEERFASVNEGMFNAQQRSAYVRLCRAIDRSLPAALAHPVHVPADVADIEQEDALDQKLFFLDAIGGAGKTLILNTLAAKYRARGVVVLTCASSGIAALQLKGGKTAHSTFGIPIGCNGPASNSSLPTQGHAREMLREVQVVIWDEAPMASKHDFDCVDRLLQDVMRGRVEAGERFGGKVLILSGDFRQTLAVLPHAKRGEIVANLVSSCEWYARVRHLHLLVNERIRRALETERLEDVSDPAVLPIPGEARENPLVRAVEDYQEYLLGVGNGHRALYDAYDARSNNEGLIPVKAEILFPGSSLSELVRRVYAFTEEEGGDRPSPVTFSETAILSTKNKTVSRINEIALTQWQQYEARRRQGQGGVDTGIHEFLSVDSVVEEVTVNAGAADQGEGLHNRHVYAEEYLNTVEDASLPPHRLQLAVGAPVILLRSLDYSRGLCNGTRMRIVGMSVRILTVEILTGTHIGETVLLPRIDLVLNDNKKKYPFQLRRRQFPVRLAFGMTINKAQGQSLSNVGIYLPEPVFAHGQLYVALSRASHPRRVQVLVKQVDGRQGDFPGKVGKFTCNVVFREVLTNIE